MTLGTDTLTAEPIAVAPARMSLAAAFISFLVYGGIAAAIYVGLTALIIELRTGVPDWIVSSLCYGALIFPVYYVHRRWSFRSTAPHGHALPRYVVVQLCGLALVATFSYVAFETLHLPGIAGATLVMLASALIKFVVLRFWAFATRA
jgi:putative flippase GtrA